jgi:hypothetical protein
MLAVLACCKIKVMDGIEHRIFWMPEYFANRKTNNKLFAQY